MSLRGPLRPSLSPCPFVASHSIWPPWSYHSPHGCPALPTCGSLGPAGLLVSPAGLLPPTSPPLLTHQRPSLNPSLISSLPEYPGNGGHLMAHHNQLLPFNCMFLCFSSISSHWTLISGDRGRTPSACHSMFGRPCSEIKETLKVKHMLM